MTMLLLIIGTLLAFFAGWFFLRYLTVHPLKISFTLTLTLLTAFGAGVTIYAVIRNNGPWLPLLALSVAGFLVGYLISTKSFLNQEDSRYVPDLTREKNGKVSGHTAIVYFTHGEPETFNPIGWLNQFREFDEQGIRFVPFIARPFFISMLRNKYLEVGKSQHRQTHKEMLSSLETLYKSSGDSTTKFYLCFLDDEPRPDAAVIRALNEGAGKIVVATVFLTVSNHTAEGQEMIRQVTGAEKFGVDVVFTNPLWDSEILRSAFLEKIDKANGGFPKEKVAVALIGHGQPDEWDKEWPTETEQEQAFREEIVALLVEDGYKKENIGSAWMEFKSPKPAELMGKFIGNGVSKVFYFSTAISADAIHSQADVPHLVEEYDFPNGVDVINLGAWNNHPTVIRAIKERIDNTLKKTSISS